MIRSMARWQDGKCVYDTFIRGSVDWVISRPQYGSFGVYRGRMDNVTRQCDNVAYTRACNLRPVIM